MVDIARSMPEQVGRDQRLAVRRDGEDGHDDDDGDEDATDSQQRAARSLEQFAA